MAFDATQFQKGQQHKKPGSSHVFLFAMTSIIFGLLLMMKLLDINYAFLKYIPDVAIYWMVALGSVIGGLYMIYRKYIYRQRLVVR